MLKYNCIIVEDEPLSAEILTDYIKQVPFLELRAVCADAIYAMEILQKERTDLIFLDIHLPRIKGLEFLGSLRNPPPVIIVSAYKEYALEGFELNVIDYLLKPVRFSRFLKAVNKLPQQQTPASLPAAATTTGERTYFFFSVGKKKVKVFLDEILYIESLREYVRITTKEKNILTKFQLSRIEELLSQNNFLRIHRSFIVAKDKITAFTTADVEINNKQIPIGRSYKEWVVALLERDSS
ncbi:MAG TPA: LytTR family DNA-binding domain-containing protein [Puia sp.]|nr:LytTR family DNA-binding domain-containing protein [Puia sp.]